MDWFLALDTALFRWINQSLANPVCDWLMPRLAGPAWFIPAVVALAVLLLWKGGRRERVFVPLLALVILLGDPLICNTTRKAIGRPRPGLALQDTRALLRSSSRGSFPSAHAANWFATAMVCLVFYRRSWRFLVPAAATVAFSRVYVGVHYPSDVLAGAILGAGCAAGGVWSADRLWARVGRRWFPLWWQKLPSLLSPEANADPAAERPGPPPEALAAQRNQQWLRLGYIVISALLLFRLGYVASGVIELSKDEAYQWLWSKHLALSYYSKPLGIAVIQFVGTSLWGDTELGVRFFSPVFAALMSLAMLRFLARETEARHGFLLLLVVTGTPLLSVGTILMTIDPPLVLGWTLALIAGWRAVQPTGTTRHWLAVGAALGLAFLCKYSAVYQIACWALFLALWKPARIHLRRPGPYLALLLIALCTLPVVIWNMQHDWITATHVADNASLDEPWRPSLRYLGEFLGMEAGLLNPVFFVAALWAAAAAWRQRHAHPLWLYLFCMGTPVFVGHVLYSLHGRIQPNWIAPAILPMLCLMILYWETRWRAGCRPVKAWFIVGLGLGGLAVTVLHESNFIGKLAGHRLPAEVDPLRRVRAWKETTAVVENARARLEAEGTPTFVIANHYGMTGLFTFYGPESRRGPVPIVYPRSSAKPENQFYFWPEYRYRTNRRGQNAIYVAELRPYSLEPGWLWKWLAGRDVDYARIPPPAPAPAALLDEFETVTSLGIHEVTWRGRVLRRLHLYECRNLRSSP